MPPIKRKYRSGYEGRVAKAAEARGAKHESDRVKYLKECTYIPDFTLPNGVMVEAKGYFTSEDRSKMCYVRDQRPELDIRILFQDASKKLNKASKTTYGEWATKKGFIWHSGDSIPDEWYQ